MKTKLFVIMFIMSGLLLMGQSITITSPNGGESWEKASSHSITWTTTGITTGTMRITLWQGEASLGVIATDLPVSQHSYPWTVGNLSGAPAVGPGSGYTIKIRLQGETPSDTSDGTFSITLPPPPMSITVEEPNGGESWKEGSTKTITWKAPGVIAGTYRITLWQGSDNKGVIAAGLPFSQHSYVWEVGVLEGGSAPVDSGYKVKIRLEGESLSDESNGTFSIVKDFPHINPGWLEKFKKYRREPIPWWDPPGPDPVPDWIRFRVDKLKDILQGPTNPVEVGLLRDGKLLTVLGEFKGDQFNPARGNRVTGNDLHVKLGAGNRSLLLKGGGNYSLQLSDVMTGKVITTVPVQLEQQLKGMR
ncbi:MAG: GPI anchored serine-threonine rich family protein [Acidobacteriota bacterium]|jgi:hypothetical protein|nr:GPI anchored serine-threonine rich family protein [Acidobacteriota bacterium]